MRRLLDWLRRVLGYAEPVRVRAVAMSLAGLALSLGLTAASGLPGWADTALVAYAGIWPVIQGWLTRDKTTSTAKVDHVLSEHYVAGAVGPRLYDQLRAELVTGGKDLPPD